MMNFGEMQTVVGEMIQRPDSSFQTKIGDFINERLRSVVALRPWVALLRYTSVNCVAASPYIFTPQEVEQIIDIHQEVTPANVALMRYYQHLNKNIDTLNNQDVPVTAIPQGESGIKQIMSADGQISISGGDASDVTQTVIIRGYNTSKIPIQESLTLNGLSAVTSANTYSSADGYEPRFSKSADTNSMVTIRDVGSNTIAQLGPQDREARYKKWRMWPIPISAYTMYITFKKRTYKLTQASDVPELECDNLLILGAYARCLEEKRQTSKAQRIWGNVDANGQYPAGSYGAELEALIAKEPQFQENFQDQFTPIMAKDPIDQQVGYIGIQLRPGTGAP